MILDACRALIVGDYFTPRDGAHAGQLGPWAKVVSAVGVDPRGTPLKTAFVLYGVAWIAAAAAFARGKAWAWWAMVAAATGSLWYLVAGTASSVLQLVLLLAVRARRASP